MSRVSRILGRFFKDPPALPEPVLSLMREIGKEIDSALAPQFPGNSIPIGFQWDYDAAIGQARFDLKQATCKGTALDAAYQQAAYQQAAQSPQLCGKEK